MISLVGQHPRVIASFANLYGEAVSPNGETAILDTPAKGYSVVWRAGHRHKVTGPLQGVSRNARYLVYLGYTPPGPGNDLDVYDTVTGQVRIVHDIEREIDACLSCMERVAISDSGTTLLLTLQAEGVWVVEAASGGFAPVALNDQPIPGDYQFSGYSGLGISADGGIVTFWGSVPYGDSPAVPEYDRTGVFAARVE